MRKIVQGVLNFRDHVFGPRREWFQRLAAGQRPEALFLTCSDARIDPNLLTGTEPGELFILRNAGNLVPPYGTAGGGEAATLEFAVAVLKVRHLIVCGHTRCGVMRHVLEPGPPADLPAVAAWLTYAEATRRLLGLRHPGLTGDDRWAAAAGENVLVQLAHLRTHPAVAAAAAAGALRVHGWVYRMETGEVSAYEAARGRFVPLTEEHLAAAERAGPAPWEGE
jgi:carbonic anhydrase